MRINDIKQIAQESRASQDKLELEELLLRVDVINPKTIVEIGVHRGRSLVTWKRAWPNARVIGIEKDANGIDLADTSECQLIIGDSHHLKTLEELEARLGGNKIDFLFIDADHTFNGVSRDFQLYKEYVRKGGMIALHDAFIKSHPEIEVFEFFNLIVNDFEVEMIYKGGTGVAIIYYE